MYAAATAACYATVAAHLSTYLIYDNDVKGYARPRVTIDTCRIHARYILIWLYSTQMYAHATKVQTDGTISC